MTRPPDSNPDGSKAAQPNHAEEASAPAAPDFTAFLTLVKETGRLLNSFVAPDDFVPDAPLPPAPLAPDMVRHLGAASLADFYSLALEEGGPAEGRGRMPVLFPEGPESIRPAQTCLEREIARLKRKIEENGNASGRDKEIRLLDVYRESRANLIRAARLWPDVKAEALKWPEEAKALWQKAVRLEEGVNQLLKSFQDSSESDDDDEAPPAGGRRRQSLTRAATGLKKEVESAKTVISEKGRLSKLISALMGDMEGLLAATVDASDENRDWAEVRADAERRFQTLEREETRLKDAAVQTGRYLSEALETLAETEERISGRRDSGAKDRLEAALRGVQALLKSTLDRRRDLARIYFALPTRIGRPLYLEKTHLVTAAALGRTQSLLEEMRHRLTLAAGRISSTHQLRREGLETAERLAALPDYEGSLNLARRRMNALGRAVEQRLTLKRVIRQNAESEMELSHTRLENDRLGKQLKAAVLESDRLGEQLAAARHSLGEMGRFKAKLLKVYAKKSALLQEVETSRQEVIQENAEIKAARAELKRKRARLAAMYKLERGDLKRLSAEFETQRDELALNHELLNAREAERKDLESRLEATRQERDQLAAVQRELETKASGLEDSLAEAAARAEGLSAELNRLREELAEVSRGRRALGDRISSLRRKVDLLGQAQAALQKSLRRKNMRLDTAEKELERHQVKLTRQNKNILRLVAVRQELRAELGNTRLRLSDLEKERDDIFGQLAAVRVQADEAARERDQAAKARDEALSANSVLGSRIGGLESENSRLLGRVTELGGEVMNLTETKLDLTGRLSAVELQKAELSRQLEGLRGQVESDLAPLIKILGQALWQSEAAHQRTRDDSARTLDGFKAESGMMMDRLRMEADVREANIRLRAAARELEVTDASLAERRGLMQNLENKEEELASANQRAAELESRISVFQSNSDQVYSQNQELSEAVSRLTGRNRKLRKAMDTLKHRYGGRLEEARSTEMGLRDLIDSQNRELKRQKRRLGELEPLVAHFLEQAESGLTRDGSADLSLVRYMKDEAGEMQTELGGAESGAPLARLNSALMARLEELQPLVAFLARSFVASVADLAQARQERSTLADQLREADSTRGVLETSLDSRQSELAEMRDQAFELTRERDQLKSALVEKDNEILVLKTELAEADRDLAENDGRLEAAWAGLNYLGTKAGDNLARMKARLENQTRQVDHLSVEMKNRDERIRELEDRQDKLALLYWALVSRAMNTGGLSTDGLPGALALPAHDIDEIEPVLEIEAEPLEAEDFSGSESVLDENEERGGSMGRELLDSARKAARRSLFTLMLAGGLVMSSPVGAALPPEKTSALSADSLRLSTSVESSFVGRTVSLDFVEPGLRVKGLAAVEGRMKEKVAELAQGHSLSPQEFLKLVRQAKAPEALVHLSDFAGPAGAAALLEKHLPQLSANLGGRPEQIRDLLRAASSFRPGEGAFWERIYFNFSETQGLGKSESLVALLELLARKQSGTALAQPEFAGRMAPFLEIENMGAASFIDFMSDHIKQNWPVPASRGRLSLTRRLSGDLYFSARLHRLPLTLLSSIAQQELEEGRAAHLLDGQAATIFLYRQAEQLASLVAASGEVWQNGRAPLCDLDEILAEKYGRLGMENIFRKKMKIIMSYNKVISQGHNLLSGLCRSRRDNTVAALG
ncbi:hypothetical protein C4J81_02415 [Deltaproteobacteria bacterium Smac51]|nr:hypothetical protein C4J81_02415 [Deltaproteobacteria bacterium Smac51]